MRNRPSLPELLGRVAFPLAMLQSQRRHALGSVFGKMSDVMAEDELSERTPVTRNSCLGVRRSSRI